MRKIIILAILILCFVVFIMPVKAQQKSNSINCGIIITHMAVSPEAILEGITPFAKFLTTRLGLPVKVELLPDTNTMIKKLEDGTIQLGYVSNLEYLNIKAAKDVTPFAKVVKGGSSTYNAIILVRKDSNINDISELKGKKFAYTSKDSSHGYLYPALLIKTRFNKTPETFFGSFVTTKKDPDGILSVLYKKADAVSVSSQTYAILSELMPRLKRELNVISTSEPLVHGPMFYYAKNFNDKSLIERCKKEVLSMGSEAQGKQILLLFKIGGWTIASDADYNGLRNLMKKI